MRSQPHFLIKERPLRTLLGRGPQRTQSPGVNKCVGVRHGRDTGFSHLVTFGHFKDL